MRVRLNPKSWMVFCIFGKWMFLFKFNVLFDFPQTVSLPLFLFFSLFFYVYFFLVPDHRIKKKKFNQLFLIKFNEMFISKSMRLSKFWYTLWMWWRYDIHTRFHVLNYLVNSQVPWWMGVCVRCSSALTFIKHTTNIN